MSVAWAEFQAAGWHAGTSRRRQLAIVAVLLGHVSLYVLIMQVRSLPAGSSPARQRVLLRLVPPSPALRAPVDRAHMPAEIAAISAAARPHLTPPSEAPTQAPTGALEGLAQTGADAGVHGAVSSAGAAASAASGLNLQPSTEILRGALVNPATLDPRSNSPKPTFEERIAMGLDPELCVKLVRDDDGVVRRRMGRLVAAQTLLQSTHGVRSDGVRVCE